MKWSDTGSTQGQSRPLVSGADIDSSPTGTGGARRRPGIVPLSGGLVIVVHGRPVSWNRAYRFGRGGGGRPRMYLTHEAEAWEETVFLTSLDAYNRSSWRPGGGLLVVDWRMLLDDDIDGDNAMKLVHDGLARALKVNDKRFLPRLISKRTGLGHNAISLTIYDHQEEIA